MGIGYWVLGNWGVFANWDWVLGIGFSAPNYPINANEVKIAQISRFLPNLIETFEIITI